MRKMVLWMTLTVSLLVGASTASAAPTAAVSPTSGTPTASVTVTGSGLEASTSFVLFFDTTSLAVPASNASGNVSFTFKVPADAQPGTHWITLDDRRTHAAAQAPLIVSTDWPQSGFGPSKRSFNPYENTITTANVNQLTPAWSQPLDNFGNTKPPIVYQGNIYARDALHVVRAFSPAGRLLWTAATPSSPFPDSLTPAAGDGKVFFSDFNGNVIAYDALCRSDGGTCTPAWTTTLPGAVAGGITLRGNKLYVPDADGKVHVLDPTTGTEGAPIVVTTAGTTPDPLTTWIAFGADGTGYVGHGSNMAQISSSGVPFDEPYSGALSGPAVAADTAYSTETDNLLREMQLSWTAPLGGSGCFDQTPPAYADGVVYAAGCTSLGAYDAGNGSTRWSTTTPASSSGLSVANGVLYGCVAARLVAYSAASGSRLWSGGFCSTAPVVADGVLYNSYGSLSAYTLTGAQATLRHHRVRRPNARRLMARWLAHHHHATRHRSARRHKARGHRHARS